MSPTRLLIADDHAVIRTGIKYLLASHFPNVIAGEADACSTLNSELNRLPYSHLILDMQLGDCNSLDLLQSIISAYPLMRIMIYTMSPESIYGKRLIQMGADAFLSKEEKEETLLVALTQFLQGKTYMSDDLRKSLEKEQGKSGAGATPFEELSEREMMVMRYLLQGLRVKEISNRLDLKMSTVATYKVRIFEKLRVDNVADLHRLANAYHLE